MAGGDKQTGQGWFCLTIRNIRKTFRGIHEKTRDNNKRNYTITASKSIRPDQAARLPRSETRGKKCPGHTYVRNNVRLEQTHAADRTAARGAALGVDRLLLPRAQGRCLSAGYTFTPSRFRICAPARPSAAGWHGRQTLSQSVSNPARGPTPRRSNVFHGAEWTAEPIPWGHSPACAYMCIKRRVLTRGGAGPDLNRRRKGGVVGSWDERRRPPLT